MAYCMTASAKIDINEKPNLALNAVVDYGLAPACFSHYSTSTRYNSPRIQGLMSFLYLLFISINV